MDRPDQGSEVRTRLPAGGKWIRTIGPARGAHKRFAIGADRDPSSGRGSVKHVNGLLAAANPPHAPAPPKPGILRRRPRSDRLRSPLHPAEMTYVVCRRLGYRTGGFLFFPAKPHNKTPAAAQPV